MNDALREARAVDPEWAKKEARRRVVLGVLTAGVLVAIAVGLPALIIGLHNGTEITQIEHSACQVEPAGRECQQTKIKSDKAASLATSCIQFRKVDLNEKLLAQTRCKGGDLPGGPITTKPSGHEGAGTHSPSNGGDASNPSTGHSPSGPSPGGPTDTSSHAHAPSVPHQSGGGEAGGGHETSAPPAAPTSPPSSSSPPPTTTERVTEVVHEAGPPPSNPPAETAAAPIHEVVGGVVETLKPTVEGLGETAGGTVETVPGTTCELAKLLCP